MAKTKIHKLKQKQIGEVLNNGASEYAGIWVVVRVNRKLMVMRNDVEVKVGMSLS